jgi:hypothetical protein
VQQLLIRRIAPRKFRLEEDFDSKSGIRVPRGFVSDGISVPLGFRWIVVPTGEGFNAALVHDYLLSQGYSWEDANERFAAQLELDNVPIFKRKAYEIGVAIWAKLKG